jgi:proline iminopeptidase
MNNNDQSFLAPTHLIAFGEGPACLVVNGGPGLSCSYLLPGLGFLGEIRTCFLYDQPACGLDTTSALQVTADSTADQLGLLVLTLAGQTRIDILTHSWGAHVLLRAIERRSDIGDRIGKVIMANPSALTAASQTAAGQRLFNRLSADEQSQIGKLSEKGDRESGRKLMELALGAYTGSSKRRPAINFDYSIQTYNHIAASWGDFNLASGVHPIRGRFFIIRGADDFIASDEIADLLSMAQAHRTIEDCGHYPFAERPAEFRQAVFQFLEPRRE